MDLELRCGTSATLRSLSQSMTYDGLIEGLPNAEMNNHILEGAIRQAKAESWAKEHAPYLIHPERRDFLNKPGDMVKNRRPDWIPEFMPRILCRARFDSLFPARDPEMHASSLMVIWLQNDFAMPISESVLESIKAIDWKLYACDFEY